MSSIEILQHLLDIVYAMKSDNCINSLSAILLLHELADQSQPGIATAEVELFKLIEKLKNTRKD
jgi:hypothetical protein